MKRWGECRDGGIGTTVAAPVRSYRSTSGAAVRSAPSVRRPRGDGPMSHATVPASCGACSSSRPSRGCMSPRSCPDSARPAATGRQAGSQHSGCPADARARTGGGGRGACNPIRATPATTPRPRAQRERSRIHEKRPPKALETPRPDETAAGGCRLWGDGHLEGALEGPGRPRALFPLPPVRSD